MAGKKQPPKGKTVSLSMLHRNLHGKTPKVNMVIDRVYGKK